jgi:hypothetical protein
VSDMLDELDDEDMPPSPRVVELDWNPPHRDFRLRIEEVDGRHVAIKVQGPTRFGNHATVVAMVGTPTDGTSDQVLIHVALTPEQTGLFGAALRYLADVKP